MDAPCKNPIHDPKNEDLVISETSPDRSLSPEIQPDKQPSVPTLERRRGGNRSKGKGRGRAINRVRPTEPIEGTRQVDISDRMVEMMQGIQRMQQTVVTLMERLIDQGNTGTQMNASHGVEEAKLDRQSSIVQSTREIPLSIGQESQGAQLVTTQKKQEIQADTKVVPIISRQHQREASLENQVQDFLNFEPLTFSGWTTEDPQQFIDQMEIIFDVMKCSSPRCVELAACRLHDLALSWYKTTLSRRPRDATPMIWEEFINAFMDRFLPANKREKLAAEFECLRQTSNMTVIEYDARFNYLSRFAPQLVTDEKMKAKRFIQGLVQPLFRVLAPHMGKFTYIEAMEVAQEIEKRWLEQRALKETRKKAKTLGSFNGGASSYKRSGFQDY